MKVEGQKVILKPEEVCEECPAKPKWAVSMIKMYGVETRPQGRLGKFSRCPEILRPGVLTGSTTRSKTTVGT